jgi:hypothetical protein
MSETVKTFRLTRVGDELRLCFDGDHKGQAVKPVWARPISERGREISFLDKDKKEVMMIGSLDVLDADSRHVVEEELDRRYLLPRITRVISAQASFGIRYWHVETDLGERRFALKNASKNAVWLSDEHLMLQDVLGCRYEIQPYSALDERSRAEVERVI